MNIKKYINEQKVEVLVNKWTYESLSKEMGVTKQTLYNWRDGTHKPSGNQERKLAKLFGITVDELIKEDNDDTTND